MGKVGSGRQNVFEQIERMVVADKNINTKAYWDERFSIGDWSRQGGHIQTRHFAEAQLPLLEINHQFSGTICDFGCGAGDAFRVYRAAFPLATLIGIDFSPEAIRLCRRNYAEIATFIEGDVADVPRMDIIICSNVLEHLECDEDMLVELRARCKRLIIIVPLNERVLSKEHLRRYQTDSFSKFSPIRAIPFYARGWSAFGSDLVFNVYLKNVARWILGRPLRYQRRQVLFEFRGELAEQG